MDVKQLLQPGAQAPDFSLHSTPDQTVSLRDLLGGPLVLVFYPADWSPVCGDQLVLYNELLPDFRRHGASVAGISVDGVWCHVAYSKDRKLRLPLLSDFEPKGEVARAYGAYRPQDGVCERALFVIDAKGVVRWSYLSPIGVNPGADGILQALESMQNAQAPSSSGTSHEPTNRSSVRA
jgi:peroxiredoxin